MTPGWATLLIALAQPAAGEPRPATWPLTDERLARIGSPKYMLMRSIDEQAFADPDVISAFRRIGINQGCTLYNRAFRASVARHEPSLRPVVIAALRRHVPADVLAAPAGWNWPPMPAYHRVIIRDVEANGAAILAMAREDLSRAFLAEAASAPAASAAGAGGDFADWDLEKPLARKTACMVLRAGPPDNLMARKRPFDQFYRRGDAR